jgi:hypothetical protein
MNMKAATKVSTKTKPVAEDKKMTKRKQPEDVPMMDNPESDDSTEEIEQMVEQTKKRMSKEEVSEFKWKLCKPKYVLIFKHCTDCNNYLFKNKKKFTYAEGLMHLSLPLCDECQELNIELTDLIAPPKQD